MNLIRLESLGMMFLPLWKEITIIYVVMAAEVCEENPMEWKFGIDEFRGVDDCYRFLPQAE